MRKTIFLILTTLYLLYAVPQAYSQAIRPNPGFHGNVLARNDDGSTELVPLGFAVNFFGRTRNAAYVNNNGNITFDTPLADFTPYGLVGVHQEIIAAYFADVDTRNVASQVVRYGRDTVNGRPAFGVNYLDVGYYDNRADKLNSFQLVLIERSDTGAGNFDIEFNYSKVQWETGEASNGSGGRGGVSAAVGWSNGSGDPGTSFELPGSLVNGAFLDGGPRSLARNRLNTTVVGRYLFRARGGSISPGLSISSACPLPSGTVGVPYRQQLTGSGSLTPMRWSMVADPMTALPGLALASDGVMSGVPTAAGDYSFTVSAVGTDEDGESTLSARCSLAVRSPALQITSACPLPAGTVGSPYRYALQAADGPAPYDWSLAGSTLAPGLSLTSAGQIQGTPTTAGTFSFPLRVRSTSDPSTVPADKQCSVTIAPTPVRLAAACLLPPGTVGNEYSAQLNAAGGTPPYRWTVRSQLPQGLVVDATGLLFGTPLYADEYQFSASVRDASGSELAQTCSLSVRPQTVTITNSCPVPDATAGSPYAVTLTARGGTAPYRWWTSGTLPNALSLSSDGILRGTPTAVGPSAFRLQVADANGQSAVQSCTLRVLPAAGPYVNGGCPPNQVVVGEGYNYRLQADGGTAPYLWNHLGDLPPGILLSTDGVLAGVPATAGAYNFTLSAMDRRNRTATQSCTIQVRAQSLPRITTACPLAPGQLGQPYGAQWQATGGAGGYQFRLTGPLPNGLTSSTDGILSGTPAVVGQYTFVVEVMDRQRQATSKVCALTVSRPPLPALQFTDTPAAVAPATVPRIALELAAPYVSDVRGQLSLRVVPETGAPDAAANQADPRVRLTNGQTTASFTIPAGTRRYVVPLASTGTVASEITLGLDRLQVGEENINLLPTPRILRVERAAPVLTDACFTTGTLGATLNLTGYSTTRQLTSASLTAGGTTTAVDLRSLSDAWFLTPESVRFGGAFTLTLPLPSGASTTGLTVAVRNDQGASGARSVSRCP